MKKLDAKLQSIFLLPKFCKKMIYKLINQVLKQHFCHSCLQFYFTFVIFVVAERNRTHGKIRPSHTGLWFSHYIVQAHAFVPGA